METPEDNGGISLELKSKDPEEYSRRYHTMIKDGSLTLEGETYNYVENPHLDRGFPVRLNDPLHRVNINASSPELLAIAIQAANAAVERDKDSPLHPSVSAITAISEMVGIKVSLAVIFNEAGQTVREG